MENVVLEGCQAKLFEAPPWGNFSRLVLSAVSTDAEPPPQDTSRVGPAVEIVNWK